MLPLTPLSPVYLKSSVKRVLGTSSRSVKLNSTGFVSPAASVSIFASYFWYSVLNGHWLTSSFISGDTTILLISSVVLFFTFTTNFCGFWYWYVSTPGTDNVMSPSAAFAGIGMKAAAVTADMISTASNLFIVFIVLILPQQFLFLCSLLSL